VLEDKIREAREKVKEVCGEISLFEKLIKQYKTLNQAEEVAKIINQAAYKSHSKETTKKVMDTLQKYINNNYSGEIINSFETTLNKSKSRKEINYVSNLFYHQEFIDFFYLYHHNNIEHQVTEKFTDTIIDSMMITDLVYNQGFSRNKPDKNKCIEEYVKVMKKTEIMSAFDSYKNKESLKEVCNIILKTISKFSSENTAIKSAQILKKYNNKNEEQHIIKALKFTKSNKDLLKLITILNYRKLTEESRIEISDSYNLFWGHLHISSETKETVTSLILDNFKNIYNEFNKYGGMKLEREIIEYGHTVRNFLSLRGKRFFNKSSDKDLQTYMDFKFIKLIKHETYNASKIDFLKNAFKSINKFSELNESTVQNIHGLYILVENLSQKKDVEDQSKQILFKYLNRLSNNNKNQKPNEFSRNFNKYINNIRRQIHDNPHKFYKVINSA